MKLRKIRVHYTNMLHLYNYACDAQKKKDYESASEVLSILFRIHQASNRSWLTCVTDYDQKWPIHFPKGSRETGGLSQGGGPTGWTQLLILSLYTRQWSV